MSVSTLLNIEEKVGKILKMSIEARDNDKYLLYLYLNVFHGIHTLEEYSKSKEAPAQESLSRLRRKLQESGLYPPSPRIAIVRVGAVSDYKSYSKESK